ncbi:MULTISPECIES: hypothetical protein [Pseudomonas]|uniref:Uncharacterized protein n=1 Tax=Pseudomonas petroselini TaxID=2899822 RepID=A0ABS8QWE8_9PSED|nr:MULTISPECIES: hypothetical protein [Pseudomonas]MCD7040061.1 hypothetical protein [Pseudomonas petroselini]MCD7046218.1 hypothetical protein [Pseudomonas petroselini]MCD7067662.1 hypothetical protein [Pseudomonas petroselini]MCD7078861.1 hypothetical protein [Pseudomonas petroselini]MCM2379692.1 hypothetical protein [Pseudomonas marginalis]
MSATSMTTADKIPDPAFPVANSNIPRAESIEQMTIKPATRDERVEEGSAFLTEKNMTPIPAYNAAARRPTNPVELDKSTPQLANTKPGANIQVKANAKKSSEIRIASVLKLICIKRS